MRNGDQRPSRFSLDTFVDSIGSIPNLGIKRGRPMSEDKVGAKCWKLPSVTVIMTQRECSASFLDYSRKIEHKISLDHLCVHYLSTARLIMKVTGRTRAELTELVLKAAAVPRGATKATLMYRSYLSLSAVRELLFSLRADDLIQYMHGEMRFKTTDKGLQFLSECSRKDRSLLKKCGHQCIGCGVLFDCKSSDCEKPFHYSKCPRCLNFVLQSSW
jgi:predicted transcriptional regulator